MTSDSLADGPDSARPAFGGDGGAPDDEDDAGIAPRPRPGYRTPRPGGGAAEKAQLFAGVLRAGAGCAGLFAALLYLPIQAVTPILAGVSILMMVTGCTSTWRAVRDAPSLKLVLRVLVAGCAAVTLLTLLLTWILGAGSLGPLAQLKAERARAGSPTVHFER